LPIHKITGTTSTNLNIRIYFLILGSNCQVNENMWDFLSYIDFNRQQYRLFVATVSSGSLNPIQKKSSEAEMNIFLVYRLDSLILKFLFYFFFYPK
jgi:hypothetical protein